MNIEIAPKSTETRLTWSDAKLYCFSLNIDGKHDWRLPTIDELMSIRKIDSDFVLGGYYWSSTEVNYDNNCVYCYSLFDTGYRATGGKSHEILGVRPVRDLKDN